MRECMQVREKDSERERMEHERVYASHRKRQQEKDSMRQTPRDKVPNTMCGYNK